MYKSLLTIAIALISFTLPAIAMQSKDLPTNQDGSYLNISVTEQMDVKEDLLISSMRIEKEGVDKYIQDEINLMMPKAVKMAKEVEDITVSTEQYYVYQYNQDQNIDNKKDKVKKKMWRGTQVLSLKSKSSEALLTLIGKLQNEGLLIQSLNYTLSNEKREVIRDSMIEAAIAKLKQRAIRVAKALGKEYDGFTMINVDPEARRMPVPRLMMGSPVNANDSVVNMPVAEPSTSEVTITVSATALLKYGSVLGNKR
ncbi:MAG: SIMPL domain-containing protein [Rickettsia sp.]|jgi:predicted secreted protein|nr:SIMPL domain-containing protein [Rickettsia sp.]